MSLLKLSVLFCSLASWAAGDRTADFKSFTENPGRYLEADFTMARPSSPTPMFQGPRNFRVKWQSNGFLLQQYDETDELSRNAHVTGHELMGEFEKQHWEFETFSQTLHVCDDVTVEEKAQREKLHDTCRGLVATALNGGIQYADIGIIKWSGNSFTAANTNLGYELKGELAESAGVPTAITYEMHDKNTGKTFYYESRLSDWREGSPIPHKVDVRCKLPDRWVDVALVEVNSVKRGTELQGRQVFSYERFFRPDRDTILKRAGGTYYGVNALGQIERPNVAEPAQNTFLSDPTARVLVGLGMGLILVCLVYAPLKRDAEGKRNRNPKLPSIKT